MNGAQHPSGQGLLDSLQAIRHDSMLVAESAGAGKAYQAVAQATAMAVQDATDSLRNMSTVSTVAIGTVLTQLIETGELSPNHLEALDRVQKIADRAAETFCQIGVNASMVLAMFPAGTDPGDQG